MPSWVSISAASYKDSGLDVSFHGNSTSVNLMSGQTMLLTFGVNLDILEPGTGQGTVAFGVQLLPVLNVSISTVEFIRFIRPTYC